MFDKEDCTEVKVKVESKSVPKIATQATAVKVRVELNCSLPWPLINVSNGQLDLLDFAKKTDLVRKDNNKISYCQVGLDFWGEGRDNSNNTGGNSFINLNKPNGYLTTKVQIPNLLPVDNYTDTLACVQKYVSHGVFSRVTLMGSPVNGSGESGTNMGNDPESIAYILNQEDGMVIIYGKNPNGKEENKALQAIKDKLPDHEMYSFQNTKATNGRYTLEQDGIRICLIEDYGAISVSGNVIVVFFPKVQIKKDNCVAIVKNTGIVYEKE